MIIQTKLRRDAAADWTSQDPTLAQGEIGIETDTFKFKIGNGSTAWTSLSYPYYLSSEVDAFIDASEAATISGHLYAGYVAADAVVTAAYIAADTTLSGDVVAQLHTRAHNMTGTSDHDAGNWKVFYSDGSGDVIELALTTSGTFLTSNGAAAAPSFENTTGYTGSIPTISGTMTVVNGLITAYA
jgi:hypothetical protein